MRHWLWLIGLLIAASPIDRALAADEPSLPNDVLPLLKARCVKCHGPAKQEAKLDLSTPSSLARGGETGTAIAPSKPDESLLWQRVEADEMPPEEPLSAEEKGLLRRWIASGAKGLPEKVAADSKSVHWSFAPLHESPLPAVSASPRVRTPVDRFVLARLEDKGLAFNADADRWTLVRRASFDLTGLPPTPDEILAFVNDDAADAYERMVERFLASSRYGQRWGKYWLDAAGYADSNGYFNADSDRPLAYRYRDYVVRALNADKPFDRFVVEQLAGDELAGHDPSRPATPDIISLLEATHYLRNAQDGSGESDGNAEEVRADRYFVLEGVAQIVSSSLLGLTMQCAKCHDHKFDPITQRDYYQLQSVFYPVFNIQDWIKPSQRFVYASLPGETERWEEHARQIDAEVATLKRQFVDWARANRPPSVTLFHDEFDDSSPPLVENWSNTAPGDDVPAGSPPVELNSAAAPGARRLGGSLQILESGAAGDRWLSTRQSFDWTPDEKGEWIQVTFDLVQDHVEGGEPAARIAYLIGLCDFNDNGAVPRGNVLFDGKPAGGVDIHVDYPGVDSTPAGDLGRAKYQPGHNYGVRITNVGDGKCRISHLIDGIADESARELPAEDLCDGGFGFEYCCGRSFVVDNVIVERSVPGAGSDEGAKKVAEAIQSKHKELAAAIKQREAQRGERPGKISCAVDGSESAPEVFLLERGNHGSPREPVMPAPLAALTDGDSGLKIAPPPSGAKSTGRRLAWANWLTEPGSRQAALVARVQVNRIWQHHFGTGIVATTENLGTSGAAPSHPELLELLAAEFIRSGWSLKAMHRLMLNSTVYRQACDLAPEAHKVDPDNRLLWRHSLRRLDAESIRDAMLTVAGALDGTYGGSYVPTTRRDSGEVVVDPKVEGANRRSLYLQQRRTQTLSMLNVFDAPTLVFNCLERPTSTMPLQSLALLNSEFSVAQATRLADRLEREAGGDPASRVRHAFVLALAREPLQQEVDEAMKFVASQQAHYSPQDDAQKRAWADWCQMLLASNAFLYVE
jgi:hypothetical protein